MLLLFSAFHATVAFLLFSSFCFSAALKAVFKIPLADVVLRWESRLLLFSLLLQQIWAKSRNSKERGGSKKRRIYGLVMKRPSAPQPLNTQPAEALFGSLPVLWHLWKSRSRGEGEVGNIKLKMMAPERQSRDLTFLRQGLPDNAPKMF